MGVNSVGTKMHSSILNVCPKQMEGSISRADNLQRWFFDFCRLRRSCTSVSKGPMCPSTSSGKILRHVRQNRTPASESWTAGRHPTMRFKTRRTIAHCASSITRQLLAERDQQAKIHFILVDLILDGSIPFISPHSFQSTSENAHCRGGLSVYCVRPAWRGHFIIPTREQCLCSNPIAIGQLAAG